MLSGMLFGKAPPERDPLDPEYLRELATRSLGDDDKLDFEKEIDDHVGASNFQAAQDAHARAYAAHLGQLTLRPDSAAVIAEAGDTRSSIGGPIQAIAEGPSHVSVRHARE